jgi:outer membrane receptor protein involved in Fe transport
MKRFISLFLIGITASGIAVAQVKPAAQTAAVTPEIVVTGSRIPQPNMESSSPITVKSDLDIKLQGSTEVADLINNLPQNFQNSQIDFSSTSNPLASPGGISTADLRGLGPQRTLVLINGRRLGTGDANTGNSNPSPDLNQIPTALVERVEVVTGGASAVYGSDAVAGVVNFILKRNFEGVEIDGQYGFAQHSNENSAARNALTAAGLPLPESEVVDGRNKEFSVLMGSSFDGGRANATVYFNYRDAGAVTQGTRDFSACKIGDGGGFPICKNSSNSNRFIPLSASLGSGDFTVVNDANGVGQFLDYPQAGSTPPPTFNSSVFQVLQHPDTRYSFGFLAHDDFNEKIGAYMEFGFMNDRARTIIAPSATFLGANAFDVTGNGGYQVNCDNPLLSAQQFLQIGCDQQAAGSDVTMLIGRRNVEGLGRESDYEHTNYRGVFGLTGDVGQGWVYDAYLQYYYTSLYQANNHYLSNRAVGKALQVVADPTPGPNFGKPICKSKLDGTDALCVPWNIFTSGGVTPDQVAYIDSLGTNYGTVEQKILAGNIRNDLGRYGIKTPWANSGVSVDLGVEHRFEKAIFTPDKASQANDLSGAGGASVSINGAFSVTEEFLEVQAPILDGKFLAENLTLGAAYRHSDYTITGGADTFRFNFQYSPVRDVTFRGTFNRAIRAPNLIELFNSPTVTNTSVVGSDPCSGAVPSKSPGECARTGVTPATYGTIPECPASQCSILLSGNRKVTPETADTISVGFTFTPTFIDDFTASVDYFHVKVADEINQIPIDVILADCLDTGNPFSCAKIKRTPAGLLFGTTIQTCDSNGLNCKGGGYIDGTVQNLSQATTSGIDFQAAYRYMLPGSWGSLTTQFDGSYLDSATVSFTLPTPKDYDCAGLFGATCQTLNPRWRHTLRLSWNTPWDVTASLFWRHIGGTSLDTNSSPTGRNKDLSNGKTDTFNPSLPPKSYMDIAGTWQAGHGITVRAGINNLFDTDPPLVSADITQTGSPNTYPTYDLLGRVFFVGATAKF